MPFLVKINFEKTDIRSTLAIGNLKGYFLALLLFLGGNCCNKGSYAAKEAFGVLSYVLKQNIITQL